MSGERQRKQGETSQAWLRVTQEVVRAVLLASGGRGTEGGAWRKGGLCLARGENREELTAGELRGLD